MPNRATSTHAPIVTVKVKCAQTPVILDVNPPTYAEIRNSLRAQNHSEMVGNKLIHIHEVTLREREPMEGCDSNFKGLLLFGGFFAGFIALLIWVVTGIWR